MSGSIERILSALNEADPHQLRPGEPGWAPTDEYLPEAEDIAAYLNQYGTIDDTALAGIWHKWFGTTTGQLMGAAATTDLAAKLRNVA